MNVHLIIHHLTRMTPMLLRMTHTIRIVHILRTIHIILDLGSVRAAERKTQILIASSVLIVELPSRLNPFIPELSSASGKTNPRCAA